MLCFGMLVTCETRGSVLDALLLEEDESVDPLRGNCRVSVCLAGGFSCWAAAILFRWSGVDISV